MGLAVKKRRMDVLVERGMLMRADTYISMKHDSCLFDAVPSKRMKPMLSTDSTEHIIEAMPIAKVNKRKGNNDIRKRVVGDKSRTEGIYTSRQRFCNFYLI